MQRFPALLPLLFLLLFLQDLLASTIPLSSAPPPTPLARRQHSSHSCGAAALLTVAHLLGETHVAIERGRAAVPIVEDIGETDGTVTAATVTATAAAIAAPLPDTNANVAPRPSMLPPSPPRLSENAEREIYRFTSCGSSCSDGSVARTLDPPPSPRWWQTLHTPPPADNDAFHERRYSMPSRIALAASRMGLHVGAVYTGAGILPWLAKLFYPGEVAFFAARCRDSRRPAEGGDDSRGGNGGTDDTDGTDGSDGIHDGSGNGGPGGGDGDGSECGEGSDADTGTVCHGTDRTQLPHSCTVIDENIPSGGAIAAGTYHMIVVRAGLGLHWVVHGAEGYMDPLEGRWQPLWPQSRRSLFAGPTPYVDGNHIIFSVAKYVH